MKKCNIKSWLLGADFFLRAIGILFPLPFHLFIYFVLASFVVFFLFFREQQTLTCTKKFKQFKMVLCGFKKYENFISGKPN